MKARGIIVLFIGLSDEANEGTWTWTDGREFKFTYWHPKQPDNWGNEQDCTQLIRLQDRISPLEGFWDDITCYERKAFVCQRRPA